MDESIRLGRVAGIPIGVNWSVLVIGWLITWSLAAFWLPERAPGHPAVVYWIVASASALVFFASLLAHELAHALMARRLGTEVEGITLWLFGGVSRLRDDAPQARNELTVAVVGPLTSLGVAAGLLAARGLLDAAGTPTIVQEPVLWLALINGMLGIFNLMPAFPLDGGRVLRAALWGRTGDRARATRTAAAVGRAFGYLLVALGLFSFLVAVTVSGLWLIFLGWFIANAARAEEAQVLLRAALTGVRVRDIMSLEPVTAPDWLTVDRFIEDVALQHRFSAYPLHDIEGKLSCFVTLDALRRVSPASRPALRVRDVALDIAAVPAGTPDEPALALIERMLPTVGERALVFEEGQLVGLVSPTDLARTLRLVGLHGSAGPSYSQQQ